MMHSVQDVPGELLFLIYLIQEDTMIFGKY